MKRIRLGIVLLLSVLMIQAVGLAETENRTVQFRVGYTDFTADLPAGYLIYTPELGKDSPLLKMISATTGTIESYMKILHCVLCGVHEEEMHEIWISATDRSEILSGNMKEVSIENQRAYYDGVSVSRGRYTEYQHSGKNYFVFENNPSIYTGGASVYASFFFNKYEIAVRWESGNRKKTDEDVQKILNIAESIQTAKQSTEEQPREVQKTADEKKTGLAVTEATLFFDEKANRGYFSAKVENRGPKPVSFGNERFAAYDLWGNVVYENTYTDSEPMYGLIMPNDYIYVSLDRPWDAKGLRADEISRYEFDPKPYTYSVRYEKIVCEAKFEIVNDKVYPRTNLEVTLENNTDHPIRHPYLVYAFYDRNHQLVDVGSSVFSDLTVLPGSKILLRPYDDFDSIRYLMANNHEPKTVEAIIYYEK